VEQYKSKEMLGALLSPSSRWSKGILFELYYLVAMHGRTDLDAAFGLLAQTADVLELGPVLDTPELIAERLQQNFDLMIKKPFTKYFFIWFMFFEHLAFCVCVHCINWWL
jgi:hypothetical protein